MEERLRQREHFCSRRECGVSKELKRTPVAGAQDVRGGVVFAEAGEAGMSGPAGA